MTPFEDNVDYTTSMCYLWTNWSHRVNTTPLFFTCMSRHGSRSPHLNTLSVHYVPCRGLCFHTCSLPPFVLIACEWVHTCPLSQVSMLITCCWFHPTWVYSSVTTVCSHQMLTCVYPRHSTTRLITYSSFTLTSSNTYDTCQPNSTVRIQKGTHVT